MDQSHVGYNLTMITMDLSCKPHLSLGFHLLNNIIVLVVQYVYIHTHTCFNSYDYDCVCVSVCLSLYPSPNNASVPEDDDSPVRNHDVIELVHLSTEKLLNRYAAILLVIIHAYY